MRNPITVHPSCWRIRERGYLTYRIVVRSKPIAEVIAPDWKDDRTVRSRSPRLTLSPESGLTSGHCGMGSECATETDGNLPRYFLWGAADTFVPDSY